MRWKFGEDELFVIFYLMDICVDLFLVIRFFVWFLFKVFGSVNIFIYGGRNVIMLLRNLDSYVCEVRELFVLLFIRRYVCLVYWYF